MPPADADLAAALRRVEDTYYNAADQKDFALIATVFTRDTSVTYHVGTPQELTITGQGPVVDQLEEVVSRFTASTHVLANFSVEMTSAGPQSVTHAIAHVVLGEKILIRGLRYVDTFALEDGSWKIARRQHIPMWQYEAAAVAPAIK